MKRKLLTNQSLSTSRPNCKRSLAADIFQSLSAASDLLHKRKCPRVLKQANYEKKTESIFCSTTAG